jgi:hypothetical protein
MHRHLGLLTPLVTAACLVSAPALAQSSCSSDGQRAGRSLIERFTSADCDKCWAAGNVMLPKAKNSGEIAIDWIVPSAKGEDAPLSTAALSESTERATQLKANVRPDEAISTQTDNQTARHQQRPTQHLRVAHGLAVSGYIGTSIEWKPEQAQLNRLQRANASVTATLALVEELPAGSEGSAVARQLVRAVLQRNWNINEQLTRAKRADKADNFQPFREFTPLRVPESAQGERLRVIGWVEDAQGRVIALSQSVCS